MDLAIWDAWVAIMSWGIRILFWPLGVVIKYREFIGTTLPYLTLGVVALIIVTGALGLLGRVFRGIERIVCAFVRILEVFRFLGGRPQQTEFFNSAPMNHQSDPYHVLGVRRGVTDDELALRYKQLVQMNHPDKVAQLDPEIQALAAHRTRSIIEAYEKLRANENT